MPKYLRQCWYTTEENSLVQKHYIYLEDAYIEADNEDEAIKDLWEKYKDSDGTICIAREV